MIQKQVLRFQISMNDAQFVKVFDTTDDLLEELAGLCFLQLLLLHDVVKEFASVDELHD